MKNYLSLKDILTDEELNDLTKSVCGFFECILKRKLWVDVYIKQINEPSSIPEMDANEAVEKYNKAWKS